MRLPKITADQTIALDFGPGYTATFGNTKAAKQHVREQGRNKLTKVTVYENGKVVSEQSK